MELFSLRYLRFCVCIFIYGLCLTNIIMFLFGLPQYSTNTLIVFTYTLSVEHTFGSIKLTDKLPHNFSPRKVPSSFVSHFVCVFRCRCWLKYQSFHGKIVKISRSFLILCDWVEYGLQYWSKFELWMHFACTQSIVCWFISKQHFMKLTS